MRIVIQKSNKILSRKLQQDYFEPVTKTVNHIGERLLAESTFTTTAVEVENNYRKPVLLVL